MLHRNDELRLRERERKDQDSYRSNMDKGKMMAESLPQQQLNCSSLEEIKKVIASNKGTH
jgi:hypothetical protein